MHVTGRSRRSDSPPAGHKGAAGFIDRNRLPLCVLYIPDFILQNQDMAHTKEVTVVANNVGPYIIIEFTLLPSGALYRPMGLIAYY